MNDDTDVFEGVDAPPGLGGNKMVPPARGVPGGDVKGVARQPLSSGGPSSPPSGWESVGAKGKAKGSNKVSDAETERKKKEAEEARKHAEWMKKQMKKEMEDALASAGARTPSRSSSQAASDAPTALHVDTVSPGSLTPPKEAQGGGVPSTVGGGSGGGGGPPGLGGAAKPSTSSSPGHAGRADDGWNSMSSSGLNPAASAFGNFGSSSPFGGSSAFGGGGAFGGAFSGFGNAGALQSSSVSSSTPGAARVSYAPAEPPTTAAAPAASSKPAGLDREQLLRTELGTLREQLIKKEEQCTALTRAAARTSEAEERAAALKTSLEKSQRESTAAQRELVACQAQLAQAQQALKERSDSSKEEAHRQLTAQHKQMQAEHDTLKGQVNAACRRAACDDGLVGLSPALAHTFSSPRVCPAHCATMNPPFPSRVLQPQAETMWKELEMKDRRITALEKQISAIDRSAPTPQRLPPGTPAGAMSAQGAPAPPPPPGSAGPPFRSAGPPLVAVPPVRGSVAVPPQVRPGSALAGLGAPGAPVPPGGMRPSTPIVPAGYGAPAAMRPGPNGVALPTGARPRGAPTGWKCKHCTFENRNPPIFDPQTREQVGFCEVCQNPTPLNF